MTKIRVAVNGYGVIGKRVADAVAAQSDMTMAGVSDIETDWRPRMALRRGFGLFAATDEHADLMRRAGSQVKGTPTDLLGQSDIVVDCTPKRVAAKNVELYRRLGLKFILQGGEKHETTGHSFVAESNYTSAVGRDATRVVSCNTTSVVRTLTALKRAGFLKKARGTLLRRATDPWESHQSGIMNTLVPEAEIPSHQGPDAQTVDPSREMGKQLAHFETALPVLVELPRGGEQVARGGELELRLGEGHGLAVHGGELRLGVERINVRHAAVHEQKDDALRLRREVRRARRKRVR